MSAEPLPDQGVSEIRWTMSGRGFKHYEPIETTRGHVLRVYESSAAAEPHLWLSIDDSDSIPHLTLEQAERLRDTLTVAITRHYQVWRATPKEWKAGDPCELCGSRDTWLEDDAAGCRSCGADERKPSSDETEVRDA